MGLMLDYAEAGSPFQQLLKRRALEFYGNDKACPIHYEPSGEDFLSPCLAEADVMRRILNSAEFAVWLSKFLPGIPLSTTAAAWLAPGVVTDPTDGKLAHLDGLNLSRAWMLQRIADALPKSDRRIPALRAASGGRRLASRTASTS